MRLPCATSSTARYPQPQAGRPDGRHHGAQPQHRRRNAGRGTGRGPQRAQIGAGAQVEDAQRLPEERGNGDQRIADDPRERDAGHAPPTTEVQHRRDRDRRHQIEPHVQLCVTRRHQHLRQGVEDRAEPAVQPQQPYGHDRGAPLLAQHGDDEQVRDQGETDGHGEGEQRESLGQREQIAPQSHRVFLRGREDRGRHLADQ